MRGRKRDASKYDVYKIENGKQVYVGRYSRTYLNEELGIKTKSLKKDVESGKIFESATGKYRVYFEGCFRPAKPKDKQDRFKGMPKRVAKVKNAGGCRFGG